MRGLLVLAPLLLIAAACSSATVEPGDEGTVSAASKSTASCSLTRDQILASTSTDRANAISRGFAWLDANVPYSQSRQHDGYRTDCSGFVSMCWSLTAPGGTTADFSSGDLGSSALGSYDDLAPGDALVRRVGGSGHVMMFLGWNDDSHTEACAIEEADTALDMQFGVHAVTSLKSQSYKAIRNDSFSASVPQTTTPTTTTPVAGDDDDTASSTTGSTFTPSTSTSTATSSSGASATPSSSGDDDDDTAPGTPCANDGTCNPGNNGSGLICVNGQCTGGCHTDAQCWDTTVCINGDCVQ